MLLTLNIFLIPNITNIYEGNDTDGDTIYEGDELIYDPLKGWDLTKHLYPENATDFATVKGGTDSNEWGNWKKVVPEDIISKDWKLVAIHVYNISDNKEHYIIQVVGGDDKDVNYGYECFSGDKKDVGKDILPSMDKIIPANDPLWFRMKTADGGDDTASFRIKYIQKE
jgi:hypothetical protein